MLAENDFEVEPTRTAKRQRRDILEKSIAIHTNAYRAALGWGIGGEEMSDTRFYFALY